MSDKKEEYDETQRVAKRLARELLAKADERAQALAKRSPGDAPAEDEFGAMRRVFADLFGRKPERDEEAPLPWPVCQECGSREMELRIWCRWEKVGDSWDWVATEDVDGHADAYCFDCDSSRTYIWSKGGAPA